MGAIGIALKEHSAVDFRNGRVANANFAKYAVPAQADAPPVIDVIFVKEDESDVQRRAARAMVGIAPATTNAIYHATGKRIRNIRSPGQAAMSGMVRVGVRGVDMTEGMQARSSSSPARAAAWARRRPSSCRPEERASSSRRGELTELISLWPTHQSRR